MAPALSAEISPGKWAHDGLSIFAGDATRFFIATVGIDRRADAAAERRANIDMMTHSAEVVHECTRAGGLLWMAEQWFEHVGRNAMNSEDFQERLTSARSALAKAQGQQVAA